jgi:hypothetical protein
MLKACFGVTLTAWAIFFTFGVMILFCCKPDVVSSLRVFVTSLIDVAYVTAYPAVVVFTLTLLLYSLKKPVSWPSVRSRSSPHIQR